MTLPNGSPSHDTIQRCFHILKPNELQVIMNTIVIDLIDNFYAKMNPNSFISDKNKVKDIIAVDGKAMLGSYRASSKKGEIKKLQMLNVYSTEYSLCLSSTPIDEKTNEIPVSQEIISMKDLKHKVVTCVVLNTQKEFACKIIDSNGDYCLALKDNHSNFLDDVITYFNDDGNTTADKESARAFSLMKRFTLSLLKIVKECFGNNMSIRRVRNRIGRRNEG